MSDKPFLKETKKPERQFKGVWIPKELWESNELSFTEKALYTEIHYLDGENGCYASRAYLAAFLGKSEVLVTKAIANLKKAGLVSEDKRLFNGRQRVLRTHPEIISKLEPNKKLLGSLIENYKHNNRVNSKSLLRNKDITALGKSGKGSSDNGNREIKLNPLVQYWNNLKNTRKHTRPEKQVYKDAVYRLRLLNNGRLDKFKFDDSWLKRCDIPARYLTRTWSDKRVKEVMDMLNCLFTEGYWPENKKWLPRSLSELIYNPRKQNSLFLMVASNGVTELHEIVDKRKALGDGYVSNLVNHLRTALNSARDSRKLLPGEYSILANAVRDMDKIKLDEEHFPTLESLVKDYADWILDRFEGDEKLIAGWFKVGGYKWDDYAAQVKDGIGISL